MNLLETIGTGLIISIVTAFITVRLSLRQFYSQRWWEKKFEQYEKVLEALYHIHHVNDRLLEAAEHGKDLSPERKNSLLAKSHEGSDELEKAVSIGAFALSKKALLSLKHLRSELEENKNNFPKISYYEYLDKNVSSLNKCISELTSIARKDLSVD